MQPSRSRSATIRDVAKHAKVSAAAVSRHLNGSLVLPPETVKRIEQAVRELNYVPNAIARRLSRSRSETIGLITSDIVYPFFASIASAAEAAASERGLSFAIFNSRNDPERELRFLSRLDDHQVDGMLLMTNHVDDGALRDKINSTAKVVLLDEDVPGANAPRLFAENSHGGWLATRHLIEHGHTRIAYLAGPRGLISVDERYEGFRRAHLESGLVPDPEMVSFGLYDTSDATEMFKRLWQAKRPTAVFSGGDLMALGAMEAARQLGLSVPNDFSLVSFDDMPNAALFNPPLTTIRQSAEEFGRRGIEMLVPYLEGQRIPDPPRIKVELIVRGSVGIPPKVVRRRAPARAAAIQGEMS